LDAAQTVDSVNHARWAHYDNTDANGAESANVFTYDIAKAFDVG
jgi:hypothetical protein